MRSRSAPHSLRSAPNFAMVKNCSASVASPEEDHPARRVERNSRPPQRRAGRRVATASCRKQAPVPPIRRPRARCGRQRPQWSGGKPCAARPAASFCPPALQIRFHGSGEPPPNATVPRGSKAEADYLTASRRKTAAPDQPPRASSGMSFVCGLRSKLDRNAGVEMAHAFEHTLEPCPPAGTRP